MKLLTEVRLIPTVKRNLISLGMLKGRVVLLSPRMEKCMSRGGQLFSCKQREMGAYITCVALQ